MNKRVPEQKRADLFYSALQEEAFNKTLDKMMIPKEDILKMFKTLNHSLLILDLFDEIEELKKKLEDQPKSCCKNDSKNAYDVSRGGLPELWKKNKND